MIAELVEELAKLPPTFVHISSSQLPRGGLCENCAQHLITQDLWRGTPTVLLLCLAFVSLVKLPWGFRTQLLFATGARFSLIS